MSVLLATLLGLVRITAAQSSQQPRDAKPAFSMALSTRQTVVEVGSPLVVRLAITNTSDHDVCTGAPPCPPVQISVLDSEGKPVPETPYGRELHGKVWPSALINGFSRSGSLFAAPPIPPMRPGETRKETPHDVIREYDLSKPGTYTIQVRRSDPYSQSLVESNILTVTLVPAPERPKTSFTLTISTDEDTVRAGDKIPLTTDVTNRSDHDIVYDMAYSKLDIEVRDPQGNLAALTEGGREFRRQFGTAGSLYNRQYIKPGDTMPGGNVAIQAYYDMNRPGDYTIQVSQSDDETKTWVKSNILTVTVTP
jgi:hypothetical protein